MLHKELEIMVRNYLDKRARGIEAHDDLIRICRIAVIGEVVRAPVSKSSKIYVRGLAKKIGVVIEINRDRMRNWPFQMLLDLYSEILQEISNLEKVGRETGFNERWSPEVTEKVEVTGMTLYPFLPKRRGIGRKEYTIGERIEYLRSVLKDIGSELIARVLRGMERKGVSLGDILGIEGKV